MKSIAGKALLESTILSCTLIAWLISFLYIYLSANGRVVPSFLVDITFQQKLTFFLTTTALASSAFLVKGIQLLRKPKQEEILSVEEKNGTFYDLNFPTEETIANMLNREDDSATKLEKTKKKALTQHAS